MHGIAGGPQRRLHKGYGGCLKATGGFNPFRGPGSGLHRYTVTLSKKPRARQPAAGHRIKCKFSLGTLKNWTAGICRPSASSAARPSRKCRQRARSMGAKRRSNPTRSPERSQSLSDFLKLCYSVHSKYPRPRAPRRAEGADRRPTPHTPPLRRPAPRRRTRPVRLSPRPPLTRLKSLIRNDYVLDKA